MTGLAFWGALGVWRLIWAGGHFIWVWVTHR